MGAMTSAQAIATAAHSDECDGELRVGEFTLTPHVIDAGSALAFGANVSYKGIVPLGIVCRELGIAPRDAFKLKGEEADMIRRGERILYMISLPVDKWNSLRDVYLRRHSRVNARTRSTFPASEFTSDAVAFFKI
jgi:hypothetical protein